MSSPIDLQTAKGRVIDAIDATLIERLSSGRDAHEVRRELADRFAVALDNPSLPWLIDCADALGLQPALRSEIAVLAAEVTRSHAASIAECGHPFLSHVEQALLRKYSNDCGDGTVLAFLDMNETEFQAAVAKDPILGVLLSECSAENSGCDSFEHAAGNLVALAGQIERLSDHFYALSDAQGEAARETQRPVAA
jgi:hypothetical protein